MRPWSVLIVCSSPRNGISFTPTMICARWHPLIRTMHHCYCTPTTCLGITKDSTSGHTGLSSQDSSTLCNGLGIAPCEMPTHAAGWTGYSVTQRTSLRAGATVASGTSEPSWSWPRRLYTVWRWLATDDSWHATWKV
jgi:hypothetical protein